MIAPCVNILRQLAQNYKQMLGTDIGTAHHPMDLLYNIPDLMDSLKEHEVYSYMMKMILRFKIFCLLDSKNS